MTDEELYHHGILGQKWGVRRFQNSDGSLTEAGKKRYAKSELYRKNELSSLESRRAIAKSKYDMRSDKYASKAQQERAAGNKDKAKHYEEKMKAVQEKGRQEMKRMTAERKYLMNATTEELMAEKRGGVALAIGDAFATAALNTALGQYPIPIGNMSLRLFMLPNPIRAYNTGTRRVRESNMQHD